MYNNPDYPTASAGGFLQHTYQPEAQNQSMFYNGFASNPFAQNPFMSYGTQCAPDSRRNFNMMPNQNPYGYQQPVMQQPQTEQVVPFGSYPPASPNGQQAPTGLNSLIESRRNLNLNVTQNNATSANPWMQRQNVVPQQPVQMQNPITTNPYENPFSYGYQVEPSVAALYNSDITTFDKKTANCWENQYTVNRPLAQPNVNWYGQDACQQQTQQPMNPYQTPGCQNCNNPYQSLNPMGASPVKFNPSAESYLDIAKKNWSMSNI